MGIGGFGTDQGIGMTAQNKLLVVKEGFLQYLLGVFQIHMDSSAVMAEACRALTNIVWNGACNCETLKKRKELRLTLELILIGGEPLASAKKLQFAALLERVVEVHGNNRGIQSLGPKLISKIK